MKTYKTVKYQAEKTLMDSCLCNMCGREVSFEYPGDNEEPRLQHAVTIKVIGEYRHCSLPDMTVLWIDLCEDCLTKDVIGRLKIKPTEGDDFSWIRPEKESQEVDFSKIKEV